MKYNFIFQLYSLKLTIMDLDFFIFALVGSLIVF